MTTRVYPRKDVR